MRLPHIKIADCRRVVGERFFITEEMMLGRGQQLSLSHPRAVAMMLARDLIGASYPLIGKSFHKDHSTAVQMIHNMRGRVRKYRECRAQYRYFREQLTALSRERTKAGHISREPIQLIRAVGGIDIHRNTFSVAAE
jgi:hypothetical protein